MKGPATAVIAPLILGALLLAGVAAIWHVGHNLVPDLKSSGPDTGAPDIPQVPPSQAAAAATENHKPAPSGSAAQPLLVSGKEGALDSAAVATAPASSEGASGGVPVAPSVGSSKPDARDVGVSPGPPGSAVATRLVETPRGRFVQTGPILFNSGMAELRPASLEPLNGLARFLKDAPEIRLLIVGHTDNLGVEAANQLVSAQRAAAVKEYLASRGIDVSRLESVGKGSTDPIESNDTLLGRQANRRIEFLVVPPK